MSWSVAWLVASSNGRWILRAHKATRANLHLSVYVKRGAK